MARREKPEDPPPSDIPFWFITYSDVITLMMTFFILLLTFATSEPENFVQMQVAVFQGSGGNGVAGKATSSVDQDSILYRQRPSSGRRTTRGAEMPPQESDPTFASVDAGLEGMEEKPEAILAQGHAMVLSLPPFVADGKVTPLGEQRLRMIAHQLRKDSCGVLLQVSHQRDMEKLLLLTRSLESDHSIPTGKMGVGMATNGKLQPDTFRILFHRSLRN
jgi:flagellar motor protein MotB